MSSGLAVRRSGKIQSAARRSDSHIHCTTDVSSPRMQPIVRLQDVLQVIFSLFDI